MKNDSSTKSTKSVRKNSPRLNNNAKTGRRASSDERLYAAELLNYYAANKDITVLINALKRFAENGTFVFDEKNEQDLILAMKQRALRDSGLSVEKATAQIASEQHLAEITVIRRIKKISSSTITNSNPLVNFLQQQVSKPYKKKSEK
jgi:hypothetical protein